MSWSDSFCQSNQLVKNAVNLIAVSDYLCRSWLRCCGLAIALGETALAHYHVDDFITANIEASSVRDGLL
jgi:hypothetical protein